MSVWFLYVKSDHGWTRLSSSLLRSLPQAAEGLFTSKGAKVLYNSMKAALCRSRTICIEESVCAVGRSLVQLAPGWEEYTRIAGIHFVSLSLSLSQIASKSIILYWMTEIPQVTRSGLKTAAGFKHQQWPWVWG